MRILYVENHEVFPYVVTKLFLSAHEVEIVPSLAGARSLLSCCQYDAVLMDYDLDDGKGDELVPDIRAAYPSMLIIAVSSHDRGNAALSTAGARAVCAKTDFSRIQMVLETMCRDRCD